MQFFPPTSNHPKFVLHAQIDVPNMSMKEIWKHVSYNAPLKVWTDILISESTGQNKFETI